MNIILEYPWWFVVFCLLLGGVYSGVLYYKNTRLQEMPIGLLYILAVVRFVIVFFLAFLLLSPFLNTVTNEVEKPIVIIAQDNSLSLLAGKDSTFYRQEYKQDLHKVTNLLSEKYDVQLYSLGEKVEALSGVEDIHFSEKQTDISSLLEEVETRYSNRNIGAIVIASDGLYNKGNNPLYSAEKYKVPIYTVGLGDTTLKKDLWIQNVEHNRLAFLGNSFPLQVLIQAQQLKGTISNLSVWEGNKELFSKSFTITSEAFTTTMPLMLEAKKQGLRHYKVKCSPVAEEATEANNVRDIYIDVLDSKQKVLILAAAPHPDVAALRSSIAKNQNYEVDSYTLQSFDNRLLKGYNLVILHGSVGLPFIKKVKEESLPIWILSGANTLYNSSLSSANATIKTNESEAFLDKDFALFTLTDDFKKACTRFPAVVSPYANSLQTDNSQVFLYQKIGTVQTQMPLMTFYADAEYKTAVFYGEGLWKWRLYEYEEYGNQEMFDEFVSKTVQYLAVKANKSFFRVSSSSSFLENERIVFTAEVYNDSYEPITTPDISITIKNENDKKYEFTFGKTDDAYRLDAGVMPVGEYDWEAKVKVGENVYSQKGLFHIKPLQMELLNITADHQLLYALSAKHNGVLINPHHLDELHKELTNREDIKSVVYVQSKSVELVYFKWIFFLLVSLISLEWFLRKRNGLY